jgi:hypothetical protein
MLLTAELADVNAALNKSMRNLIKSGLLLITSFRATISAQNTKKQQKKPDKSRQDQYKRRHYMVLEQQQSFKPWLKCKRSSNIPLDR